MSAKKEETVDLKTEEHIMTLLLEGRLGIAARKFIEARRLTEETLPMAIDKLAQSAQIMLDIGIDEKSADHLQNAMYLYFFHGLLQEFLGRKQMDEIRLKSAQNSYDLVEDITGTIHRESEIFRVANPYGFQETMRRRKRYINNLRTRKFS